jgi:hypothetical protein
MHPDPPPTTPTTTTDDDEPHPDRRTTIHANAVPATHDQNRPSTRLAFVNAPPPASRCAFSDATPMQHQRDVGIWRLGLTVSIRRMSLGSGYTYLIESVARNDIAASGVSALTQYYAESGTPPGRFLGAGLAGLDQGVGVTPGSQVDEQMLFRMLGMLADPITGEPLGRAPRQLAGIAPPTGARPSRSAAPRAVC